MNTSTHGSTGPRTAEGKAISSKNALKHGFTSRDLVIPDELRDEFEALQSRLLSELTIRAEIQNQAFRQYLRATWNLYRLDLEEARLFNEKGIDALLSPEHAPLQRYRRQQERSRAEAMAELRRTYKEQEIYDAWVEREAAKARLKKRFEEEAVRFAEEDAPSPAHIEAPPLKQAA